MEYITLCSITLLNITSRFITFRFPGILNVLIDCFFYCGIDVEDAEEDGVRRERSVACRYEALSY
jgi:hypothetical protein